MNLTYILGIVLGMVGALMMNIGKGVQKQKVHVLLQGQKILSRQNRRDFGIWLVGLTITTGAILPFSLGLKFSGSPSTISAMTGIGLIGLVLYAIKVIGEKISTTDAAGIVLVIVGTSLLGYLGTSKETVARGFIDLELTKAVLLMGLVSFCACIAAFKFRCLHGITFGLTAGLCIGVGLFLGDAALVRADRSFTGQLSNPYPYVALAFAITAVIATQIGFLRGRALEVVPAVNSATILTPLYLEIIIYRTCPEMVALSLIATIFVGVFLLSTGTLSRVSS